MSLILVLAATLSVGIIVGAIVGGILQLGKLTRVWVLVADETPHSVYTSSDAVETARAKYALSATWTACYSVVIVDLDP